MITPPCSTSACWEYVHYTSSKSYSMKASQTGKL